jgi:hypothetical protein
VTDLDRLIEAVEAGSFFLMDVLPQNEVTAYSAFSGDLNAAKALHEALLPGWGWEAGAQSSEGYGAPISSVWLSGRAKAITAGAPNPARAWLLAILKAYRSTQ